MSTQQQQVVPIDDNSLRADNSEERVIAQDCEGGGVGSVAPAEQVNDDDKPMNEDMETFDHPAEYWLACIGFAVGFGNIWRFPFMCYKMGGACFLIPYCVSLFLIAMPMYLVETVFG